MSRCRRELCSVIHFGFDAALSSIDVETYGTAIHSTVPGANSSQNAACSFCLYGQQRSSRRDWQDEPEHVRWFQSRGCHAHPLYCWRAVLLIKSFLLIIYSPLFTGSLILEAMLVFFFTRLSECLDYNLLHKEQANWCQSDLLHRWFASKGPLSLAYGEDKERC